MKISKTLLVQIIKEELSQVLSERKKKKRKQQKGKRRARKTAKRKKKKKKKAKRDACYHKVRARYDVWPSAYASGALVKCRKVGAANWGKSTTKEQLELQESPEQDAEDAILKTLDKEGGAAGLEPLEKATEKIDLPDDFDIEELIKSIKTVAQHDEGDYIEMTGLKKKK